MKTRVPILVMLSLLALALFAPAALAQNDDDDGQRPAPQLLPAPQPPALRTMRPRCQGREVWP